MKNEECTSRQLADYLLGCLAENETEQFDEMSITDDGFAHGLEACENDLVDAYGRDELDSESIKRFHAHYLASPLRRKKVEVAAALRDLGERDRTPTVVAVGEERGKPWFISGFAAAFGGAGPGLGLAAAGILLLILGALFWIGSESENHVATSSTPLVASPAPSKVGPPAPAVNPLGEDENANAEVSNTNRSVTPTHNRNAAGAKPPGTVVASIVLTPALRGGQITTVNISPETSGVAARLELEANDYSGYRVALADESGRQLWQSGTLTAQSRGTAQMLHLRFPSRLLKSEVYNLVVSGVSMGDSEVLTSYAFRVVVK